MSDNTGAFIERMILEPTGSGILNSLTFAVKDLMDVAGYRTGCGNPTWRDTHPPATVHAICVEQVLAAGARCIGKTITDELAYSLIGENYFYGTPLNPKAPDRVPGGSSSGSASAVACGLVDFAFGTDTGGSVRVPAANCGIWGMRPTHGIISIAGVNPLSPTFDTVGILAADADVLARVYSVLLSMEIPAFEKPETIHVIREAFALCGPEVRPALKTSVQKLRDIFGNRVRETSMREVDGESGVTELLNWYEIYRVLVRAEAESCLGSWIAGTRPEFGPLVTESFELTRALDRSLIPGMKDRREKYFRRMKSFLGKKDLICIPTAPFPAPLKGSMQKRDQSPGGYYTSTLSLTSIAGVTRSPQISIPVSRASSPPLGLSLMARTHEDAFLLATVRDLTGILDNK